MAGRERALGHVFITQTLCFPVAEGAVVVPAASSDGGRRFPGDWSLSSKGKEVDQYDSVASFREGVHRRITPGSSAGSSDVTARWKFLLKGNPHGTTQCLFLLCSEAGIEILPLNQLSYLCSLRIPKTFSNRFPNSNH